MYDCDGKKITKPFVPPKPLFANDGREVPADKLDAMRTYWAELKKKFPKMKDHRIDRKVAERFKIKLTKSK